MCPALDPAWSQLPPRLGCVQSDRRRLNRPRSRTAPGSSALQREAVELLTRAARADVPGDDRRRAVLDAAQRLEALGAEPDRSVAPDGSARTAITPELRADLRRAAVELAAFATQAGRRLRDASRCGTLPWFARESPRPTRRRSRPRLELQGKLQPDTAEGTVIRRPCVRDGPRARAGILAGRRVPLARHVRGGKPSCDEDLLWRTHQRPHPGIGVRRRRAHRLRR